MAYGPIMFLISLTGYLDVFIDELLPLFGDFPDAEVYVAEIERQSYFCV